MNNHLVLGILAHVDAGKTTLSEGLLYLNGSIRKLGRVDNQDAFLDTYAMERARGITIFSKQAELTMGELQVSLLDTPGHVDFSAEMERTLQVLDYGILVISGADGIQGHTRTLWKLLEQYNIPVFIFINKMDQQGTDRETLLAELQNRLDKGCIDFSQGLTEECLDGIAACGENELVEEFLETGTLQPASIAEAIKKRRVFPCYFGSALKLDGVEELIEGISQYACPPIYDEEFGARVYKISRDQKGTRLTHLKLTGGSLRVKEQLLHKGTEDKVDQLRIYSGSNFEAVPEVQAGMVCAVAGLEHTYCGEGLGKEADSDLPILEPVLKYRLVLPEDWDVHKAWRQLQELGEENPMLRLTWEESTEEIQVQLMGEIELEILKATIQERFDKTVSFQEGSLVYKETIEEAVIGMGHYEPLRHYAEVHLLLEPGESGSGLQIETQCSEDKLDRNWQQQVISCLEEQKHPGVLTGSEITDMKITLIAGRDHVKHTEGGDFREATRRALRQGLRKAKCQLLEPVYEFRLEIPSENSGRAMSDIQRMHGSFQQPEMEGEMTVIVGQAPVASMSGYQSEVNAYTKGLGKLFCTLKGYMPCHNQEEVIEQFGYQPEEDTANPTGSVFCSHGAGTYIPWDQVEDYMHIDSETESYMSGGDTETLEEIKFVRRPIQTQSDGVFMSEEEVEEILKNTHGSRKQKSYGKRDYDDGYDNIGYENSISQRAGENGEQKKSSYEYKSKKNVAPKEKYLLVDGYNILFAWEELKALAQENLGAARDKLMDLLCDYQGYKNMKLLLVFDAYKVPGNTEKVMDYHNIQVVYTKEAQTADQYIEKLVHEKGKQYEITVATSDRAEQMIIWGEGARRLSARDLKEEMERAHSEMSERYLENQQRDQNYAFQPFLSEKTENNSTNHEGNGVE